MTDRGERPIAGTQSKPTLLTHFAELCRQLAATTKKLEKRALIAAYLQSLPVEDAGRASLYLAGAPFAETDRRRLQIGGSTLSKAIAELTGASAAAMHEAYRRHGDLGDAAYDLLLETRGARDHGGGREPALTLAEMESAFTALALARGPSAKLALFTALLERATPSEARYLVKLVTGDMRTGVKQSLVEEAIAACYGADARSVRHAVMLQGDLAEVVAMAAGGTLSAARMRLFHPLGFMLASPVDSVDEAMARFAQEVAIEAAGVEGRLVAEAISKMVSDEAIQPLAEGTVRNEGDAGLHAVRPAEAAGALEGLAATPALLLAAQLEDKYDGMRAQLHCGDPTQPGRVGLFSRNREDIAESFPELIEAFSGFGEEVILDGEILAWRPAPALEHGEATMGRDDRRPAFGESADNAGASHASRAAGFPGEGLANHPAPGRALPFASLQQRLGRKRVTDEMRRATPVVFMAFDLLYHAGEIMLERPLVERRARLAALVATHGEFTDGSLYTPEAAAQGMLFAPTARNNLSRLLLAPAVPLTDATQLDAAYNDARGRGNEGVMLKAAASLYQPGRRGLAWLKLKRELATLDVVITGAEYGSGRRAGVLSDYTFAVRNPTPAPGQAALLNVGKAYSGVTDAEIDTLSRRLVEQTIEDYGSFRTVAPTVVLEVAFNNIMRSDRHASGFALRFPRILHIRDDKPVEEIDTLARVEEIFSSQPDKPAES